MSRASLGSGAFSHMPSGLWIARGSAYGQPHRMQAGICRQNFEGGEVDQVTRSETNLELVPNARERHSQGVCCRISVDLRMMGRKG